MKKIIYKIIKQIKSCFFTVKVKRKCAEFKGIVKVNANTRVTENIWLGSNVNFNGMCIEGNGKVVIGDNFHSGKECLIITHVHNYDKGNCIPYDNTYINKDVIIEDNVWIGAGCRILGGSYIQSGSIIAAGAVVKNKVLANSIMGGIPAKKIKERS